MQKGILNNFNFFITASNTQKVKAQKFLSSLSFSLKTHFVSHMYHITSVSPYKC